MDLQPQRQLCGRPNSQQMRALLDELEAHPFLARGRTRGPDGRRVSIALWRQISQRLNALDGCTKTHKQWQKFWADKKAAVKKLVTSRRSAGDPIATCLFSNIECRIVALIETGDNEEEDISTLNRSPQSMQAFQIRQNTSRPSLEQVKAMLGELEANPYLARGKLRGRSGPLWDEISQRLNMIDGCKKTYKQWQKYWSDKKQAIKRSLEAARVSAENNGPDLMTTFSEIEHRVLALMERQNEINIADSPTPELNYVEQDYYSDVAHDSSDENPLIAYEEKVFNVKQELDNAVTLNQTTQKVKKTKLKQKLKTKKRSLVGFPTMWRRLLALEETRLEASRQSCDMLDLINASLKQQESSTKDLTKVLLRLLR